MRQSLQEATWNHWAALGTIRHKRQLKHTLKQYCMVKTVYQQVTCMSQDSRVALHVVQSIQLTAAYLRLGSLLLGSSTAANKNPSVHRLAGVRDDAIQQLQCSFFELSASSREEGLKA